jgi:hypothetical protein
VGAYQAKEHERKTTQVLRFFLNGLAVFWYQRRPNNKKNALVRNAVVSFPSPTDSAIAMGYPAYKIYQKW